MRREGLRYGRKEGYELVSEADIRAAEMLHEAITGAFPDDGWLSEEHVDTSRRLGKARVWVVDPIDGTREFLQGIPEYAISVGLTVAGEPVLGVVYNPATGEMFATEAAVPSTLSGASHGADAAGAARFEGLSERPIPRRFDVLIGRGEQEWDEAPPLPPGARTVGMGSVAYRLAKLSAGTGHAVTTGTGRSEWDVAAGAALCMAAGLTVTDVLGEPLRFNQREPYVRGLLVAAAPLHLAISTHFRRRLW